MGDKMPERERRKDSPSWDLNKRCLDPLVNVDEKEEKIVLTVDLPCVDKEDINVRVKRRDLILEANMRREMRFETWGGAHRKISFNSFRKEISLPAEVDTEEIEASFNDGILKVEMGKKDVGESERDIEIK